MELTFDRLLLPDAVALPLSAKIISVPDLRVDREGRIHGRGHPKRDAIGWAIPILWPAKVLTLPSRFPRPTLKGEVRVTVRLMEDVDIPATVVASRISGVTSQVRRFSPDHQDANWPRVWPDDKTSSDSLGVSALSTTPVSESIKVVGSRSFTERIAGQEPTLLLLKDNSGYLVTDYWLEDSKLHCLTLDGEHKVMPLGKLDLSETVRLNRERNVQLVLRSQDDGQH